MYSIHVVHIISINGLMITKEGNQKKSIKDGHTGILVTCLDESCTHHLPKFSNFTDFYNGGTNQNFHKCLLDSSKYKLLHVSLGQTIQWPTEKRQKSQI